MSWRAVATVWLAGCGAGTGIEGAALPVAAIRPGDRVVLGDFSEVRAIAASYDRVYVAYPSAVGIWDPLAERWEAPRSAGSRLALADVFSALIDPLDRSLWLAARGGVVRFDPLLDRWERQPVPGTVQAIGLDPGDPSGGLWVRSSEGWFLLPRIGPPRGATPPAALRIAPTLEDAYRDMPGLQSFGPALALGPGLDPGRLTAAAPAASGAGWFIGTSRRGAYFVDRIGNRATPLSLGLPGDMVGALAEVPGGVWVTTDDDLRGRPAALSFVPDDLGRTVQLESDPVFGLGIDAARRILAIERTLWLATNVGVLAVRTDGGGVERWDESDGLADQRVIALAWWQDGVVAGTMRGLAVLRADGTVHRPLPGLVRPVYALFGRRDTLWIGTERGLLAHVDGNPEPIGFPSWARTLGSSAPVLGIGVVGDTLVAMTSNDVFWRDPATSAWIVGPSVTSSTGPLRALATTPQGVWVGGDRGAAFLRSGGGVLRILRVGPDLPDAVTAIASGPRWLWVGTRAGLVRLRLGGR